MSEQGQGFQAFKEQPDYRDLERARTWPSGQMSLRTNNRPLVVAVGIERILRDIGRFLLTCNLRDPNFGVNLYLGWISVLMEYRRCQCIHDVSRQNQNLGG